MRFEHIELCTYNIVSNEFSFTKAHNSSEFFHNTATQSFAGLLANSE